MEDRVSPRREEFESLCLKHRVVPVHVSLLSDWWTPVSAFHRVAGHEPYAFLLESVEGGERLGRYSMLGCAPQAVVTVRDGACTWSGPGAPEARALGGDSPLDAIKRVLAAWKTPPVGGLPPFVSGAVGYFGYETVRWVERLPRGGAPRAPEPDAVWAFLKDVAVFDHLRRRLHLVVNVWVEEGADPGTEYDRALSRLRDLESRLRAPHQAPAPFRGRPGEPRSNVSQADFMQAVERAKEHVTAGDVFQVVLSRRFTVDTEVDDLTAYRSLRAVNPSPYLFLLRMDGWSAVGSSPEPLLCVREGLMEYRPIAGTMPRGNDPEEDRRLAESLRADPKERAEHVMLVDLGRNDLGRVAEPGSVTVEDLMRVERYSHVMHLVSELSGRLRRDLTPLDALFACFPAGTVSGAPKVRAMEIIEELEPDGRGLYAGAVGYIDLAGNLDTCIALRTMVLRPGQVSIQAGAGVVADSDPAREYAETGHKARALLDALRRAGELG